MRIALFRPLGLASLLSSVPALRALDAAFPQASITLIGLPQVRDMASRLHRYIDEFAAFPGFPGLPGDCDIEAIPEFFERMKRGCFDLAVQMHGSGEIANPLMVLMSAAQNAGFFRPGRYCPDAARYLQWQDDEDDVQRWLRLAAHLGAEPRGSFLEFPLEPQDWDEWRALGFGKFGLEKYVCLHCGPQASRYAEIGDALAAEGWNVVLTGSPQVAQAMREPAIALAGRTSIGGTAAVIAKARLVVSSDPEASLIAQAMRTPTAALSPDVRQTLREARELLARAA